MNPPYCGPNVIGQWLRRMVEHNDGIVLIFARTETENFHKYVWPAASALLFLRGRLFFHRPNGKVAAHNAGAPSVLIGYGQEAARRLRANVNKTLDGWLVIL